MPCVLRLDAPHSRGVVFWGYTRGVPTKPTDTPEPWATAGNYPASVFPATFPWGDPRPDAGLPTPWSGQPRRESAGLAGVAANGATPLQPDAANIWNEELHRVVELTRWVFLGSSTADQDAHIVETDANGTVSTYGLAVGSPVQLEISPALGTIEFKNGAALEFGASLGSWTANIATTFNQQITANGSIQMNAGANLADGQAIIGGTATGVVAELIVAVDRLQLGASGTSTLPGQLTADANNKLRYREAATDEFVDTSTKGRDRSSGVQEASTGLLATVLVPTKGKVIPLAAPATITLTAVFQGQRSGGAGTITVELQEDQGTGVWVTPAGFSQQDTVKSNALPNDWSTVTMSRDFTAPDLLARQYRIRVTGGATNQLRSARIVAAVSED